MMTYPVESPLISIIVAIYNVERFLARCIKSILAQTFQDFEMLLVDDGSTDSSGKLCDEFAEVDCRVRVIHKENGGVASARQCGVDNAKGEYILHVDPDDWIEPEMLQLLYKRARETVVDMVICNMVAEKSTGAVPFTQFKNMNDIYEFSCKKFPDYGYRFGSGLHNKMMKVSICRQMIIPESLLACEDGYVILRLLSKRVSFATVDESLYHYDMYSNDNSLSGYDTRCRKSINNRLRFLNVIKDDDEIEKGVKDVEIANLVHHIFNYNLMSQMEYSRQFFRFIPNIVRGNVPLRKKVTCVLSVLGMKWFVHRPYLIMKSLFLKLYGN